MPAVRHTILKGSTNVTRVSYSPSKLMRAIWGSWRKYYVITTHNRYFISSVAWSSFSRNASKTLQLFFRLKLWRNQESEIMFTSQFPEDMSKRCQTIFFTCDYRGHSAVIVIHLVTNRDKSKSNVNLDPLLHSACRLSRKPICARHQEWSSDFIGYRTLLCKTYCT